SLRGRLLTKPRAITVDPRKELEKVLSRMKRHGRCMLPRSAITPLQSQGFQRTSVPAAWEHFGVDANVIVITKVPLSPSKACRHVPATSNADAPAKKAAGQSWRQSKRVKCL